MNGLCLSLKTVASTASDTFSGCSTIQPLCLLTQGNTHATTHPRILTDHIAKYHTEPRRARLYATAFRSMAKEVEDRDLTHLAHTFVISL
jgi:hypothetical protein